MLIEVPSSFSQAVIADNGLEHEMIICIEELSELQKELTKVLRGKGNVSNITSEMADVYICLNNVETGLFIPKNRLEDEISSKIIRYYKRKKEGDIK